MNQLLFRSYLRPSHQINSNYLERDDSIKVFLQKSVRLNLVLYAENVEEFLLKKYGVKGYSKEQILDMKLKTIWPFIKHLKSKKERYYAKDNFKKGQIIVSILMVLLNL